MNDIVPFDFHEHHVRVVIIEGEPWWVAADICAVLAITNVGNAMARLDAEDKSSIRLMDGTPGNPNKAIVNESGLYSLILRSDKPAAKDFKRWITGEVLPTIRRTGGYAKELSPAELLVHQAQMLLEQERRTAETERRTRELEARVDGIEQRTGWYSALGYAKREGLPTSHRYLNRLGKAAARITRAAGETPATVHNELFGTVGSYPEWALSEAAGGLQR